MKPSKPALVTLVIGVSITTGINLIPNQEIKLVTQAARNGLPIVVCCVDVPPDQGLLGMLEKRFGISRIVALASAITPDAEADPYGARKKWLSDQASAHPELWSIVKTPGEVKV